MKLIFELSKEHKTLPRSEIKSSLESEDIQYKIIDSNEDAFVIDAKISKNQIKALTNRLAMTFFMDELMFYCPTNNLLIKENALKTPIKKPGTIAVACNNRSKTIKSKTMIDLLGGIYSKNSKVNLSAPDNEIRALLNDEKTYVGLKIAELDRTQYEKRKIQHRPFFSPISMHPKIARTLVNLSGIKKGETFLDPFCGTGGIMLEAGLIGARLVGSDIEKKMIYGCKKTLDFYDLKKYELYCCDIGDIKKYTGAVDAVATDFPYGKSTTTKGEALNELYERAFKNISEVLRAKGKAVVGLSKKNLISLGENYLSLVEKHEFRVHKSLTRYFVVYKK